MRLAQHALVPLYCLSVEFLPLDFRKVGAMHCNLYIEPYTVMIHYIANSKKRLYKPGVSL